MDFNKDEVLNSILIKNIGISHEIGNIESKISGNLSKEDYYYLLEQLTILRKELVINSQILAEHFKLDNSKSETCKALLGNIEKEHEAFLVGLQNHNNFTDSQEESEDLPRNIF